MRTPHHWLYMLVTADKYELPILVTDDINEVAKYAGVSVNTALWNCTPSITRLSGKVSGFRYIRLDYDEVMKCEDL